MGRPVTRLHRRLRALAALCLLLAVLAVSRDMPTASARGLELLPMKLRWAAAWAVLHSDSPLTPLAAHTLVDMDGDLRTGLGRQGAAWLAANGAILDRLRWSAALTRRDRNALPLVVQAVGTVLASRDCGLLRAAVRAGRSLPKPERARVAREFGKPRFAHWGAAGLKAGLRVSDQPALRRALHRIDRRRPARAGPVPCAM
jgi:hypothetical protein